MFLIVTFLNFWNNFKWNSETLLIRYSMLFLCLNYLYFINCRLQYLQWAHFVLLLECFDSNRFKMRHQERLILGVWHLNDGVHHLFDPGGLGADALASSRCLCSHIFWWVFVGLFAAADKDSSPILGRGNLRESPFPKTKGLLRRVKNSIEGYWGCMGCTFWAEIIGLVKILTRHESLREELLLLLSEMLGVYFKLSDEFMIALI